MANQSKGSARKRDCDCSSCVMFKDSLIYTRIISKLDENPRRDLHDAGAALYCQISGMVLENLGWMIEHRNRGSINDANKDSHQNQASFDNLATLAEGLLSVMERVVQDKTTPKTLVQYTDPKEFTFDLLAAFRFEVQVGGGGVDAGEMDWIRRWPRTASVQEYLEMVEQRSDVGSDTAKGGNMRSTVR